MGKVLTVVFGAVASCAAVHIGFAMLGVEPLLHAAGHALAGGGSEVAVHACGLEEVFNTAAHGPDLPEFSFEGDSLIPKP